MFLLSKNNDFQEFTVFVFHRFFMEFWVVFSRCFERKNDKKRRSKHICIFYTFFIDFSPFLAPIFDPRWVKLGTKRGSFLRLAARRGLWRVPGTHRGRFLRYPGCPGGALGVSREPPGGLPGTTWLLLGSLWGLSEDILKVLGYFSLSQKVFR